MASAGGVARATIMALPKQGFEPGRPGPLEGVRVLDFSRLVAANMPSLQLAAFGAEVVKAFEDGLTRGTASVNLDGRMVDIPVYKRAEVILARARAVAETERKKAEARARLR